MSNSDRKITDKYISKSSDALTVNEVGGALKPHDMAYSGRALKFKICPIMVAV